MDAWPQQNDASRANRLLYDAFERRDWDGFAAVCAEDFFIDDRRQLVGGLSGNRSAFVGAWKVIADQGYDEVKDTVIATRGTKLVLQHFVAAGTHNFTAEALAVTQTDSGRIAFVAVFDPEDVDGGFAELDDRFAAGEGAPFVDVVRIGATMSSAYNARDWARFASVVDPDFLLTDHVPAAVGEVRGRDAYVEYVRTMTELAPDMRLRILRDLALGPRGGVSEARLQGTSADGGQVEVAWLDVATVKDRLLVRLEQFPSDELRAALARADDLSLI